MTSPTQAGCAQPFTPGGLGIDRITATFPGDAIQDPSTGTDLLNVTAPPSVPACHPAKHAKCKKKEAQRSALGGQEEEVQEAEAALSRGRV